MNCHILATVITPERLPFALLVFRTLRIGFPKANIIVYGNGRGPVGSDLVSLELLRAASGVGASYQIIEQHSHGEWIEKLIETENSPFWICDTDIVFFDRVEHWFDQSNNLFAGRYEPKFFEQWTRTIHMARLHPSLMWFNPGLLRSAMRCWPGTHQFLNTVQHNLIQWNWVPEAGLGTKFYDTCAGLHHALSGTVFIDAQNSAYEHLLCGTYAHLMPDMDGLNAAHSRAIQDHQGMRGLQQMQAEWYAAHSAPG